MIYVQKTKDLRWTSNKIKKDAHKQHRFTPMSKNSVFNFYKL
nr:MAG TPA: fermitin family-like protein [Caudoviricetes sp.]